MRRSLLVHSACSPGQSAPGRKFAITRARPNPSLERTRTGKAPWPRGARCLSCTSRPRRLTGAVRSAQTL